MYKSKTLFGKAAAAAGLILSVSASLMASQFQVLHTFSDPFVHDDENGAHPFAGLTMASDGNLYGTVLNDSEFDFPGREGWAFRISQSGNYESLSYWTQIRGPISGLIKANDGNLYGVADTYEGGAVYRFDPADPELEVIHNFNTGDPLDPYIPTGTLVQGSDGFLYGTTAGGGFNFYGTVYKVSTNGDFTVLHHFQEGGGEPLGGLVERSPGVFYGIAVDGIYRITSSGGYSLIHPIIPNSDRYASLTKGSDGNLYGVVSGDFIRVNASDVVTILHSFTQVDGEMHYGGLTEGAPGVFYGAAAYGGAHDQGTLYKITAGGSVQVLYSLTGGADGARPHGKLFLANNGDIYGTTFERGGPNGGSGTIFRFSEAPSAPLISVSPQDELRFIGQSVSFSAFASGSNPLSYQWQRNGTNVVNGGGVSGANELTLTITNLVRADEGLYRLVVTNSLGAATSAVATLTLFDYVKAVPSTSHANAGSDVTFTAETSAAAVSSYQWKRNGTNLVNGPGISGVNSAVLTLSGVLREDAGSYSVFLMLPVSPFGIASSSASLSVNDPFIVTPPSNVTNLAGATATLTIDVAGTAPTTYQWAKRISTNSFQYLISDSPKYSGVNSSTLQIHNLTADDARGYICIIKNPFTTVVGVLSSEGIVTVLIPPSILAAPQSQSVPRGSDVALTVVAANADSIQWSKGSEVLAGQTNATLLFQNIQQSAAGIYSVTVSNAYGAASASATIQVLLNPPVITSAPVNTFVTPGNNATLAVVATGATDYKWYKDGVLLPTTASSLTFSSAQPTDSGMYTVVVSNADGSLSAKAFLLVGRAGTYNGLFYQTNGVSHESSGFILLTTRTNGAYSGKVLVDGNSFSVSGKIATNGSITKVISRGIYAKADLTFSVQLTNSANQFVGTLTCSNWSAILNADFAPFSRTNITTNFGKFTLAIPGFADPTAGPAGYGMVAVTVSTNGRVTQSTYFADGTRPLVQASLLSAQGIWPLYMQAYPKMVAKTNGALVKEFQGSLLGWVTITNGAPSGVVNWNRRGIVSPFYPAGFTNESSIIGSKYVYTKGQRLLSLTNGTTVLARGNLQASLGANFILKTNNAVTMQPNSHGLRFSFSTSAGMLSGTFTNPVNGVRTTVRGIVLQQQNAAAGYFLGTNQGGLLLLQPN